MTTTTTLPAPTYLRHALEEPMKGSGPRALAARLICPCEGEIHEILHPGGVETHDDGTQRLIPTQVGKRTFGVWIARCRGCATKHTLLDLDVHGWNAVLVTRFEDPKRAKDPRPELEIWDCPCGDGGQRLAVRLRSGGRADYVSKANETLVKELEADPEAWADAFSAFALDATCAGCFREHTGLIDELTG